MAIYHTCVKVLSRSKKHSAVAAAAYRAGSSLFETLTKIQHDYSRRNGVVANLCLAPKGAPDWAVDPTRVWNAAQDAERRKDAALAREFEISLPHELDDAQRLKLVEAIGRALVDRYGFAIQASIHAPDPPDGKNHHVHILATTRRMGQDGLEKKTRELDGGAEGRKQIEWVRALVAEQTNAHLAQAGHAERVDHRRLDVQAIDALQRGDLEAAALLARQPTQHEGKAATAMHKRGETSERRQTNESIYGANAAALRDLMAGLQKEGRLMATPDSHSHAAAVRDLSRSSTGAVERATLAAATKAAELRIGSAPRRVRDKTGDRRGDALAQERRAREDEIERLMLDAMRIWQDGINEVLRSAVSATSVALFEREALTRQYAKRSGFLSDVRELHGAYAQAERDTSRFRRRMVAQERAEIAVSEAEQDLRHFDFKHPRPGLWAKREWAERRRAKADRIRERKEVCADAIEATGPEAQTRYQCRAEKSLEVLRDISARFASTYVAGLGGLEPSRATPAEEPVDAAEEEVVVVKGRRGGSGKLRVRPQPAGAKSRAPRASL